MDQQHTGEPTTEARLRHFDEHQARLLAAAAERILPADEHGAGAVDAGVPDFIDNQLGGPLRRHLGDYLAGLADLEELARERHARSFADIPAGQQDALFEEVEAGGEQISSALKMWFGLLVEDVLDGYLSDPAHGGNRDGVGWRVVGYPGPSLVWTEAEQELDAVVPFRGRTALTLLATGPRR